jgi:hypothetical protein
MSSPTYASVASASASVAGVSGSASAATASAASASAAAATASTASVATASASDGTTASDGTVASASVAVAIVASSNATDAAAFDEATVASDTVASDAAAALEFLENFDNCELSKIPIVSDAVDKLFKDARQTEEMKFTTVSSAIKKVKFLFDEINKINELMQNLNQDLPNLVNLKDKQDLLMKLEDHDKQLKLLLIELKNAKQERQEKTLAFETELPSIWEKYGKALVIASRIRFVITNHYLRKNLAETNPWLNLANGICKFGSGYCNPRNSCYYAHVGMPHPNNRKEFWKQICNDCYQKTKHGKKG